MDRFAYWVSAIFNPLFIGIPVMLAIGTAEMGIRPTDPVLAITWPLPIGELSTRDRLHPLLGRDFAGLPR